MGLIKRESSRSRFLVVSIFKSVGEREEKRRRAERKRMRFHKSTLYRAGMIHKRQVPPSFKVYCPVGGRTTKRASNRKASLSRNS